MAANPSDVVENVTQNMDLLRFATAGSVDDGKSTLIGRLLLDSKSIFEDQLEAVEATSKGKGYDYTDLALLTDGLRSEREQGITIDVAYRYFATPNRKFIIGVSENLEQMLAAEGERTSTTRAAQWEYSILHETAHLCQRIGVYTYKTEEQVDAAVAGYASFVLQQLATAKNISEKRRLKLMRHWRQVRKIAEERRANAKRNYAYLSNGYTRSTYKPGLKYLKGGKKAEKKKSAKPSAAKARKAA